MKELGLSPSRKQRMTLIGLFCVASTYTASLTMFFLKPETAGAVASLGQVAIVAVGGMIATYVGAQGYVDGKQAPQAPQPPP
jgi:hypothetical protein